MERPDLPLGFELVRYSDNLRRSSINVTPEQLARLMRTVTPAWGGDAA